MDEVKRQMTFLPERIKRIYFPEGASGNPRSKTKVGIEQMGQMGNKVDSEELITMAERLISEGAEDYKIQSHSIEITVNRDNIITFKFEDRIPVLSLRTKFKEIAKQTNKE